MTDEKKPNPRDRFRTAKGFIWLKADEEGEKRVKELKDFAERRNREYEERLRKKEKK